MGPALLGPQHPALNTPSAFEVTASSPNAAGRGWCCLQCHGCCHWHRRGTGGLVLPLGPRSQREGLGTAEISLSRLFFFYKLFVRGEFGAEESSDRSDSPISDKHTCLSLTADQQDMFQGKIISKEMDFPPTALPFLLVFLKAGVTGCEL